MNRISVLQPIFCEEIPKEIEEGKLYISHEYKTAVHLCACGCGEKTVTPTSAGNWTLTENNGKITLHPSIGNFAGEDPYHAHYLITDNEIRWTT